MENLDNLFIRHYNDLDIRSNICSVDIWLGIDCET